jgi:hypothetical protein|tara:strand:- start:3076 stop:3231 length:156 start_codon:yes stop_codon:yes gene_type:complete
MELIIAYVIACLLWVVILIATVKLGIKAIGFIWNNAIWMSLLILVIYVTFD